MHNKRKILTHLKFNDVDVSFLDPDAAEFFVTTEKMKKIRLLPIQ